MAEVHDDKSELVKQIRDAFADVPYPGDNHLSYNPEDLGANQIADAFRGKHWTEVPFETLLYHNDALHFFTDEAFHFYLPAYLLAVLERYDDADILPEMLVGVLTAPDPEAPDYSFFQQKFKSFTSAQEAAVKAFLEYLMKTYPDHYRHNEPLAALQSYWTPHSA